jgi:hypothetical protein
VIKYLDRAGWAAGDVADALESLPPMAAAEHR